MDKFISIAIDGPSASGKSTVAKILASKINFLYIDTGAMYRAFTLAVIRAGLDCKNEEESNSLIGKISISFNKDNQITLNDEVVEKEIRGNRVASNVSYIASYKEIRLFLVELQRKIATGHNVVMDGRDIGTYVLKDAQLKIFLNADVNERGKRRYLENQSKNIESSLNDSLENIKKRDYIDSHREFCPLQPASDAILVDSTRLNAEEVANTIYKLALSKGIELWVYH